MNNSGRGAFRSSLRAVLAKWRRRTPEERRLLLEAFLLLGLARLVLLSLPFKWLAPTLGSQRIGAEPQVGGDDLAFARKVGQAVRSIAAYTPWESLCLPQAVAAQWMLKRRDTPSTLFLGVAKGMAEPDRLAAHAWTRCGDIVLTGAPGHRQFTVVATFS